jgi:glycosyltransferase involved in cell wall biosynthesis
VRRLLIVSSALHYVWQGQPGSYGPYVREIDIWADLFDEVVIAAPCRQEAFPGDCLPFRRANIALVPQRTAGGATLGAKLGLALAVPLMAADLARAMRDVDAIHVRCPGNLGLIAAVLAPLFSHRLVAKYAGQWNGYDGEPLSGRIQRRLLGSRWWRGPVTVYGEWPNQPAHVVPFFTSMMTAEQVAHAADVAATKRIERPLRVLFAGALQPRKRVEALIDAARLLVASGFPLTVVIVGDGPERGRLEARAGALVEQGAVRFVGAHPFDEAQRWYEWAHCLVLPSRHSEGWPKVVAEAMSYGLVCLAVGHGFVPNMLGGRGVVLEAGTPEEIASALRMVDAHPGDHEALAASASRWARQYSLEGLSTALERLLRDRWGLSDVPSMAGQPAPASPGR